MGKFGAILVIVSLLHLVINYKVGWSKFCYFKSNLLPHCLVKFKCLTVQLFRVRL